MALVSMRQLLDHAAENSYGLPAFNVNNLEQMRAIMEAADQVNAPRYCSSIRRRTQIRRCPIPAPSDFGRSRRISAHPCRNAPRPRRIS